MLDSHERSRTGWRGLFRQRQNDPERLARLLKQEVPPAAAGIPARVTFGPFGLLGTIGYFVGPVVMFLVLHYILGFQTRLGLFLGAASVLLEFATALPHFENLNRAVSVSAEGVRLEKLHRSYLIPWWQVKSIQATNDLRRMRIAGSDALITFSTMTISPASTDSLVLTMRAHALEHGLDVALMDRRQQWLDTAIPTACHVGAAVIFGIGIWLSLPGTLGMRCSVNSQYLQDRYGTPDRQGCVVLRVSAGASSAGVKVGDLMIEFEGYPITSGQQFSTVFDHSRKPWDVTIIRRGEPELLHFKVEGGWGKTFQEVAGDPIFYYLRARWNAGDDPESAIEDYSKAIELAPTFDLAHLYRGELLEEREPGSGMEDVRRALELSPDLAEAHAVYAWATLDKAEALDHIQAAIGLSGCAGAFEEMNYDCAREFMLLASLQIFYEPEVMPYDPSKGTAAALQSIAFYDGLAGSYFYAACGLLHEGDLERAQQYAEKYLNFPASERVEYFTTLAQAIIAGGEDLLLTVC